jgi:hypothetical protein|tara:strand:- start:86 stop:433 length:348 start_codon:yes stop_codon:yes gene_type:complete
MAISYEWDCKNCDTYPAKSGKSNVVYNVHWRLTATDDSNNDSYGKPQKASCYGSEPLDTSDLSNFTNWSSLKNSDVQGWVEAAMGSARVTELKTTLDKEIAEKVSPTSVLKTLSS